MDQKAFLAITAMLNAFPQQAAADHEMLLRTYRAVLAGNSSQSIIEAAERFTTGKVQGQSKTFAPSVAEFVAEVAAREEHNQLLARPRIAARGYVQTGRLAPFEIARQRALTKFQDCPVLHERIGHPEFMAMSKARQIPDGGGWCAETGNVYGPPFEQISLGKRITA